MSSNERPPLYSGKARHLLRDLSSNPAGGAAGRVLNTSAEWSVARFKGQEHAEEPIMRTITKLLILLGFGAVLSGCVVAPYGPRPRAYVAAPVVIVHPGYYGPHYYYGTR
jgi:hypothetical protein